MTVAYNPLRTVHLFASIGIAFEKDKKTNFTQNYALNWSPFLEGALQLNFAYNETLRSEDNGRDRIITPSLRWKIASRSFLDLSYQIIKSTSISQTADSRVFSADLKIFF